MSIKKTVIVFIRLLPAAGSLILYLVLNSSRWGNGLLTAATGGFGMPDLMVFAGPAEIAGHIARMGAEGFRLYRMISLRFDFLFPLCYGALLMQITYLACRWSALNPKKRYCLFPALAAVADITENLMFLHIMKSGNPAFMWIQGARFILNLKFLFFGLSLFVIILLVLWKLRNTHPIIKKCSENSSRMTE